MYESVRGWESFEPWLSRIEKMEEGCGCGLWRERFLRSGTAVSGTELEKLGAGLCPIVRRGLVREVD